jgi:tetratricopeptide (TPR) repeat protein
MANNIINSLNKQWATTVNTVIQTTDIEDKDQLNKAIVLLNQAIELYPEQPVLYFNRGFYHFKSKNYHDAIKDAAKAVELSDEFLDARQLKCICMLEINDISTCCHNLF